MKTDDPNVGPVVVTAEQLEERIAALGKEITEDYQGRAPLLVGVLKGAFMFMSDLARAISLPVEFDFMAVSSYGSATKTSGVVRIVKDLDLDLSGRDVLLVEDIIDSGLSMREVFSYIESRGAAKVKTATFLDKPKARKVDFKAEYVGFPIEPQFVIGYGLDFMERYRNLPCIGVLRRELVT